MPLHGCGHGSFQLFRFEVIGEPKPVNPSARTTQTRSFQLFRFEVIGEPGRLPVSCTVFSVEFPTIPI